ncbi:hypothetical protein D4764_01G0016930 [Takifugu flavidus]|uniref:Uncharacterized protein n=1 Tax=Takifugu flavidus TaxID=433684 RepID=A0A5C6PSX2_9TELE|nr:hypothetical protein D4764_01G0016930 [Takifugu flavidus]
MQFGCVNCTGPLCMSSYFCCASRSADGLMVLRHLLTSPILCAPFFPAHLQRCGTRNIRRGSYLIYNSSLFFVLMIFGGLNGFSLLSFCCILSALKRDKTIMSSTSPPLACICFLL